MMKKQQQYTNKHHIILRFRPRMSDNKRKKIEVDKIKMTIVFAVCAVVL